MVCSSRHQIHPWLLQTRNTTINWYYSSTNTLASSSNGTNYEPDPSTVLSAGSCNRCHPFIHVDLISRHQLSTSSTGDDEDTSAAAGDPITTSSSYGSSISVLILRMKELTTHGNMQCPTHLRNSQQHTLSITTITILTWMPRVSYHHIDGWTGWYRISVDLYGHDCHFIL